MNKDYYKYLEYSEKGDADAQYHLARLYERGVGTQRDYALALSWYRKSADQGAPYSQTRLAMMYILGRGVKPSLEEYGYWLQKAADQGFAYGQYLLGCHYLGKYVFEKNRQKRNIMLAYFWLYLGRKGSRYQLKRLCNLLATGLLLNQKSRAEIEALAQKWPNVDLFKIS